MITQIIDTITITREWFSFHFYDGDRGDGIPWVEVRLSIDINIIINTNINISTSTLTSLT